MILSIYSLIGKGYESVWWTNCPARYRGLKGARNTKKTYDFVGFEVIDKVLTDPRRNVLLIRDTLKSHRTTTYATLKRLIRQPDPNRPEITLSGLFRFNDTLMEITVIRTGQKIFFMGMDDPSKIQGIQVETGYLTDVYVEEAFSIKSYDDWRVVDGSIRGHMPEGVFIQITFLLNAWDGAHWINERFFKGRLEDDMAELETNGFQQYVDLDEVMDYGRGIALHTSSYLINEFRDPSYDDSAKRMREASIDIYKTEFLGMWGNTADATYPEWGENLVIPMERANSMRYSCFAIGVDFGGSNGEGKLKKGEGVRLGQGNAMELVGITDDFSKMIAVNEYFQSNLNAPVPKTAPQVQDEMVNRIAEWMDLYSRNGTIMAGRILVYVDCADSGGFRQSLEMEARRRGMYNVIFLPSTKIKKVSRIYFARRLMAFGDLLVSEACPNLAREFRNARQGQNGELRTDDDDHAQNAFEYGWAPLRERMRQWKSFKSPD